MENNIKDLEMELEEKNATIEELKKELQEQKLKEVITRNKFNVEELLTKTDGVAFDNYHTKAIFKDKFFKYKDIKERYNILCDMIEIYNKLNKREEILEFDV